MHPKRPRPLLILLALSALPLLVVILYGGSLTSPFVYDDLVHIVQSPLIRSFNTVFDGAALSAALKQPRPLLLITYGFNYATTGMDPVAFRSINLIVHAANSLLVFLIVLELGRSAAYSQRRQFWVAL